MRLQRCYVAPRNRAARLGKGAGPGAGSWPFFLQLCLVSPGVSSSHLMQPRYLLPFDVAESGCPAPRAWVQAPLKLDCSCGSDTPFAALSVRQLLFPKEEAVVRWWLPGQESAAPASRVWFVVKKFKQKYQL